VSEYIKFTCEHDVVPALPFAGFADLNACRQKLRQLGVIGLDADGIGFGNLSIRDGTTNGFYITASATGGISELTLAGCAKVVAYDFARNWLRCEGPAIASSESLTHAAVYESEANVGAVIHGHNFKLWSALLGHAPTTSKMVEYGTSEMAYEVQRLFKTTDLKGRKIFVMAGHEGGVVTFGKDLEEAFTVLERVIGNE
jgi:ribulose-5-phosphate 4-epimerase/fuculose-1-phosphate aldolase